MDAGEFPLSLGSYSTIPEAIRCPEIDCTIYRYLEDRVHVDITLGNGVSVVGGVCYALIFVDRGT